MPEDLPTPDLSAPNTSPQGGDGDARAGDSNAPALELAALRDRIAELERERDEAGRSADRWRNLYSTEAQQRRSEARLSAERTERLQTELQNAQPAPPSEPDSPEARAQIAAELEGLVTPEALRAKLRDTLRERDRLYAALRAEQASHATTRDTLTAILGDAMRHFGKHAGHTSLEKGA